MYGHDYTSVGFSPILSASFFSEKRKWDTELERCYNVVNWNINDLRYGNCLNGE